jgi:choline-sulfatase
MLRRGNYKYTLWTNDIPELYDLKSDPNEMKNLAADPAHRQKLDDMKRQLLAWHTPQEQE